MTGRVVLVLNAGSSSLKFQALAWDDGELSLQFRGQIEGIGTQPRFSARNAHGDAIENRELAPAEASDRDACLQTLAEWLGTRLEGRELAGVGHRVVHGGVRYSRPVRVDRDVLAELEALVPLAPLHQPHNVAPIRALLDRRPDLPQVACFDTAFHRTQAPLSELFGLPYELYEAGIRRYGFHGLSYEYVARKLREVAPDVAGKRIVVAHLGSGASMCALHDGCSIASTMGFTALDGLPMGTRCGSLDAGVVVYLGRDRGMSMDEVERLLYQRSGLLGVSGVSNDMRELEASDSPRARLAIDYFVYRIGRELGSLVAALGGLDALVFTAGIGENSPSLRARVGERATWLGVDIDPALNATRGATRISTPQSKVPVFVIPTNEELVIAQHTAALVG
jgi:acetate kinase